MNRTPETERLLQTTDTLTEKWRSLSDRVRSLDKNHANKINDAITALERARKEFDATLFFVVVFGSLKSGKSTLVNCLARHKVSPTKAGTECTRRASIVIQSDETGIDEYILKDKVDLTGEQAFNLVVDHLRGLTPQAHLENKLLRKTSPLTDLNIEAILSGTSDPEPIITVIRTPGGDLINRNVAILDTPGLDGANSNWNEDHTLQWVAKRSEFVIFIQSTISALSGQTKDFIQSILAEAKPIFWLVHNMFECRAWRNPEELEKDALNQQQEAERRIEEAFKRNIHGFKLNVAKAEDGIFRHLDTVFDESHFRSFEKCLRDVLDTDRALIKEQRCLSEFPKAVNQTEQLLDDTDKEAQMEIGKHNQFVTNVQRLVEAVYALHYQQAYVLDSMGNQVNDCAITKRELWRKRVDELKTTRQAAHQHKLSGEQLNDVLRDFADQCVVIGAEIFDGADRDIAGLRASGSQEAGKAERLQVEEINKKLEGLKQQPLPLAGEWSRAMMPTIDTSQIALHLVRETKRFVPDLELFRRGLLQSNFDGGEVKEILRQGAETIGLAINERVDAWKKRCMAQFSEIYCKTRKTLYEHYLSGLSEEYSKRYCDEISMYERTVALCNEMKQNLNALRPVAANAILIAK